MFTLRFKCNKIKWSWYWKLDSNNNENLPSSVSMLPEKGGWGVWSESTYLIKKCSESLCMGDTDSVMIQSYYGNHSLLGKGRLLGSKVSTIFLYILPQTLNFNSPLRLKALTFHSLHGSLTTYNTFKDGEEIKF